VKSIRVKTLMVPLKEYATVPLKATLVEAVHALENSQRTLDPLKYKHRAILVLDDNGKVVSKITMKDLLIALEPNYGKVEGSEVLKRSGYSPNLIKSMLEDTTLWAEPLQRVRERAARLNASDIIKTPSEGEYIDENATLGDAIRQLVVYPHHSLLVTADDEVVGILRLSDVFTKVCEEIKAH
jgi:CBS domain-containing protein